VQINQIRQIRQIRQIKQGASKQVDYTETVRAYEGAWNEDDKARRNELLERSMVESAILVSPLGEHVGLEAVAAAVARFRRRSPGVRFVITSGVDAHHGLMRFRWEVVEPDGSVVAKGLDFAEQAQDGRLSRVVSFFGRVPERGPEAAV
jgi:hypothetical protein